MPYSFKDYLRDRGEFADDEEVFGRRPLTERVFREFKLGVFTMFVITMLLVAIFMDERKPEVPEADRKPGEQVTAPAGWVAKIMNIILRRGEKPQEAPERDSTVAQRPDEPGRSTPPRMSIPKPISAVKWYSHTVQQGDTLYSISRKYYRSGIHWQLIYKCNVDRLRSPSDLTVGKKLRIPASRTR